MEQSPVEMKGAGMAQSCYESLMQPTFLKKRWALRPLSQASPPGAPGRKVSSPLSRRAQAPTPDPALKGFPCYWSDACWAGRGPCPCPPRINLWKDNGASVGPDFNPWKILRKIADINYTRWAMIARLLCKWMNDSMITMKCCWERDVRL